MCLAIFKIPSLKDMAIPLITGIRASMPRMYSRRVHMLSARAALPPAAVVLSRYLATAASAAGSDSGHASAVQKASIKVARERKQSKDWRRLTTDKLIHLG